MAARWRRWVMAIIMVATIELAAVPSVPTSVRYLRRQPSRGCQRKKMVAAEVLVRPVSSRSTQAKTERRSTMRARHSHSHKLRGEAHRARGGGVHHHPHDAIRGEGTAPKLHGGRRARG